MSDYNYAETVLNSLDIFVFAKDLGGRFTFVNENFAAAAGVDSPNQLIGKTDFDAVWGNQGEYFQSSDHKVLLGETYLQQPEIQIRKAGIVDILTSKNTLQNSKGEVCGIVGSFIECTGKTIVDKFGLLQPDQKRVCLGEPFQNEYLTSKEIQIYYYTLLGLKAPKIAEKICRSKRTVEYHLNQLKAKMQCNSVGELIGTAVTTGLSYTIFNAVSIFGLAEHAGREA